MNGLNAEDCHEADPKQFVAVSKVILSLVALIDAYTYTAPIPKTTDRTIFLRIGICRFQSIGIGSIMTATSKMRLIIETLR